MDSHVAYRGWPPTQPLAVRCEGRTIWTADGRSFLDGASGALAVTVGHGVPEIQRAIARQAETLPFVYGGQHTTEIVEQYAAEVTALLPGEGASALSRLLLVTGGTEATEQALSLAHQIQTERGQPQRRIVLGRHLSYHGSSLAVLGIGGRYWLRQGVAAMLQASPHLPPPFPYRPEWSSRFPDAVASIPGVADLARRPLSSDEQDRGRSDPAEALAVAIEVLEPENVCAFIAEPIIGASAGAVVPDDAYWPRIRSICDRHGVLLITDEVMTGMGRTGRWLATQHWGVVPDLVVLGKGMGSGYVPLAGVALREEHWQTITGKPPGITLGYTFGQHPMAAAAGSAVLEFLRRQDLLARAQRIGEHLFEELQSALHDQPFFGDLRGRGLMLGIELVVDREGRQPFPIEWDATGRFLAAARERGLLLYPARGCADGMAGDAFLVGPAFTVTHRECDQIVATIAAAMIDLERQWQQSHATRTVTVSTQGTDRDHPAG